jgi:hypothetical protein
MGHANARCEPQGRRDLGDDGGGVALVVQLERGERDDFEQGAERRHGVGFIG